MRRPMQTIAARYKRGRSRGKKRSRFFTNIEAMRRKGESRRMKTISMIARTGRTKPIVPAAPVSQPEKSPSRRKKPIRPMRELMVRRERRRKTSFGLCSSKGREGSFFPVIFE